MLVYYTYIEAEKVLFEELLQKSKIITSYVSTVSLNKKTRRDWNEGKVQVLLCSLASVSAGLNMQYGGRHLLYLTTTNDYGIVEQSLGRLWRTGQTRDVYAHFLVYKDNLVDSKNRLIINRKDQQSRRASQASKGVTDDRLH